MSNSTPNLNLFKYDVSTDANVAFSITEALNNNWDIIDEHMVEKADKATVEEQLATKTDMLQASGAGMPSDKYIDLTLGASGSTYTAPANGYVSISMKGTSTAFFLAIGNSNNNIGFNNTCSINGYTIQHTMPVKAGEIFYVMYVNTSKNHFKFVYAEGSK